MTVSDECTGDQPDQSLKRRRRPALFGHRTHYVVWEIKLSFDVAEKKKQKQPPEAFYEKKLFLKISQYSQENTCIGVYYEEHLRTDVVKYQMSGVSTIIRKTRKCKLHQTLKKVVAERTDSLVVEYIRAEEAKYHLDCMQQFLRGVTVISGLINNKHFISSKVMDLTTSVIGISPPVKIQHRRLLFLKCRSTLKTLTTMKKRCI